MQEFFNQMIHNSLVSNVECKMYRWLLIGFLDFVGRNAERENQTLWQD
jgi:hypothetical protein